MTRSTSLAAALAAVLISGAVALAGDAFLGATFSDGRLTLSFERGSPSGGAWSGRLEIDGRTFPFDATGAAAALTGTFTADGARFSFSARLEGDVLRLTSDGVAYRLDRRDGFAPAPAPAPGPAPSPAPGPAAGWREYRHPIGFSFRHPDGWSVQETQIGLVLTPPDAGRNQQGPTEWYVIHAQPAPDISRPDDPRCGQYMNGNMMQLAPYVRSTGAPKPFKAGARDAALYAWEGTSPAGLAVRAESRVVIMEKHAIGLVSIGERTVLERRADTIRDMFASFDAGRPETDPTLVGRWYTKRYTSAGTGEHSFHSTMVRQMDLAADGSLAASGTTTSSSSEYYGEAGGQVERGRWAASGGRVWLTWQGGGTVEYRVHVQGARGAREMLLTPAGGGEKQLWTENPNQQ